MWMSCALPRDAATFSGWPSLFAFRAVALNVAQSSGGRFSFAEERHSEPPLIWPDTATTSKPLSSAVM